MDAFSALGRRLGCCLLIHLEGELDIATVPNFVGEVDNQADRDTRHVVADLVGLAFVDSSGLQGLIEISQRFGGQIGLVGIASQVEKVIELSGIDGFFLRFGSVEEARQYFHAQQQVSGSN